MSSASASGRARRGPLGLVATARRIAGKGGGVLPLLIAILVTIGAVASGAATAIDRELKAVRDTLRNHPASGRIVLVEIDAKSLAAIDRWPWPRSYHARAVDALKQAGARSIAFDVDFSARSDPAQDAAFAAALARAGGAVILPTLRQAAAADRSESIDNIPIKLLREHAFIGAVTILPDADGAVRSAPLAVETAGAPRPSLGALLADVSAGSQGYFPLDYAVDPATIPRISFVDLVSGRIAASAIRGKRVLIGATAVEMGDRYAVPRFGVVPGAVIQAIAAENLLNGRVPSQWGATAGIAIAFMALLARRRRATAVATATALLLVGPLVSQALWAADFATAAGLVMLGAGALAAAARRALGAYAARSLTRAETGLPNLDALRLDGERSRGRLVAVAHVANAAGLASALGPEAMADLCRIVADRLALSANGATIHQTDDASFAWTVAHADEAAMCDRFDALAAMLRAPVETGGRRVDIDVSFGLADDAGMRQAVANATLAATEAHAARARWRRHMAGAGADAWRLGMLGELDAAIEAGQLFVVYQPKHDLRTGRITSAEALVRWRHAERGLIPPDEFVAAAEAGGRIERLTAFVLDRALAEIATVEELGIAVNISAELLDSDTIVTMVNNSLKKHDLSPKRLTLEVTESAAMQRTDAAVATLSALRLLGVGISIDDYGTGQSTLSYLKRLPATELKIDKSFVQSMLDSRSDAILVSSTINLATELGLEVVAEGVETAEALGRLREMGCAYAQGYLIGRPMPIEELTRLCAATADRLAA